ncbi:MAG TPA: methyltransferase [Thermoplasmata archaeon]|nr:methyltransferase [Thermoplasmata archaeon]
MDRELPADGEPYFAERPRSRSQRGELRFLYRGELLAFAVDRGIFSAHGLDPGTALLIENLALAPTDRVLDLGCGWGAVGVAAAKSARAGHVVLTEVNRRAARLARENLERNRIPNAEVRVGPLFEPVAGARFDVIATNPPYRAGRPHVLALLAEAPGFLAPGGRLLLVGKGSTGIRFYQRWLEAHWPGSVAVLGRGSGYRVLEARTDGPPAPRDAPARRPGRASPRSA